VRGLRVTNRRDERRKRTGFRAANTRRQIMAKGQERPKNNNKPKLTIKEKKAKKKEKAASK
jgi:hypothetical protein